MADRAYLDWNASAPLRPEAREAMLVASGAANPSSVHAEGRAARAVVERARAQVAAAVGCAPGEVVFTSGATEAAGVLARLPGPVIVQDTAHDCLWAHRRDGDGPGTLAWGHANGETGVVTPPPARTDAGWPAGDRVAATLLVDLTQALGRLPVAFSWTGADLAVVSSHKIGGPKGAGALIVRDGVEIPALQIGGGQELGRRSGTENVAAIAGFGAAAEAAVRDLAGGAWAQVSQRRDWLEATLAAAMSDLIFMGQGMARLPNTSCFALPGWKGETQVMAMDLAGFAVSAGSACSSGKVGGSRVLGAMGLGADVAASAIRLSLGPTTSPEALERFAGAWIDKAGRHLARAA